MRLLLFWLLMALSTGYAFARGGAPERLAAAMLLTAAVASALISAPDWAYVATGLLLIDLALLGGLTIVMLRADRFWPILLVAMQAITVMVHWARFTDPAMIGWAYVVMVALFAYPMQAFLIIGTLRHQRRIRLTGNDADWTTFPGFGVKPPQTTAPKMPQPHRE